MIRSLPRGSRDRVRERAAALAAAAGIKIEPIAKSHIRKEDVVARVLAARGEHPGLVHVISAMEACDAYAPWHDKQTHKSFLRPDTGKCLHYYFYFIDDELGLSYLRVPTKVSVSAAVLLQWPWLAGPQAGGGRHRLDGGPTTPLSASMTGNAPKPSPMPSRPMSCIGFSTATPSNAARCSTCSGSPTTGA